MRSALALVLVLCAMACTCEERPTLAAADRSDGRIPRLQLAQVSEDTIQIDGRLDEAIWSDANQTGAFVHPTTGLPAGDSQVQAIAWLAWTDRELLVAARVLDAAASSPFTPTDDDPHVWERASGIELMLQPGDPGDNREYYEIQIDVAGARWTTRFDDYNHPIQRGAGPDQTRFGHQDWNPSIRYGVTKSDREYCIEFALPWSDIATRRTAVPPNPGDTWRVNLYSFRDGQRDSLAWSPILGQGNFHRASRFGRIVFAADD